MELVQLVDNDFPFFTKVVVKDVKVNVGEEWGNITKREETIEIAGYDKAVRSFSRASARTKIFMAAMLPLPMPINISSDQDWSVARMGPADILGGKLMGVLQEHGFDRKALVDAARESGAGWIDILNSLQGVVNLDMLDRAAQQGMHIGFNPYKEMLYEGPQFRQFHFVWRFAPKNQYEAKRIMELIDAFNYYAAPDTLSTAYSPYVLPATFELSFVGTKIPKLDSLVVTNVTTDLTNAGVQKFFQDGRPSFIELSVSFAELHRPVKKTMKFFERNPDDRA